MSLISDICDARYYADPLEWDYKKVKFVLRINPKEFYELKREAQEYMFNKTIDSVYQVLDMDVWVDHTCAGWEILLTQSAVYIKKS